MSERLKIARLTSWHTTPLPATLPRSSIPQHSFESGRSDFRRPVVTFAKKSSSLAQKRSLCKRVTRSSRSLLSRSGPKPLPLLNFDVWQTRRICLGGSRSWRRSHTVSSGRSPRHQTSIARGRRGRALRVKMKARKPGHRQDASSRTRTMKMEMTWTPRAWHGGNISQALRAIQSS